MDLTTINSNVQKLIELSNENQDKECDFIRKYAEYINDAVTRLTEYNENSENNEERKTKNSKKKERERDSGVEKIRNNVLIIFSQSRSFYEKSSADKEKNRKKTEQKIKKMCNEICDIGNNVFNLELPDVPEEEFPQLKKRRSWFGRSIERISRNSSECDVNMTEEEIKLKEEIENLEKELEEKKKKLNELREERRKKEREEEAEKRKNRNKQKNEKGKEEEKGEENEEIEKTAEPVAVLDRIEDLLVDGECRQAFEFLNNTSLLGNRLLGTNKSKTPRMFIIIPDPSKNSDNNKANYWLNYSNWNRSVFTLHLLCECSGGIVENVENETHLLETTGYSIRDPYKLVSLFGPFLLYSIDTLMESCGDNFPREIVKALGKTKPADYFIALAHEIQKVLKEERLVCKDESKNFDALESFIEVSRSELETFLKSYDYSGMFGGLDKKKTNEKKVRWVCNRHGKSFK